ncbi:MAG TPA: SpoIIE family protein phosphatase [Bacteroidota bacterium]|nr:SpoIIE family protein phosphatase [Bacteroidota bacterium]
MKYLDEHPKVIRLLLGLLALYLFSFAAINFYRYASTPTDENWFTNSPSTLYVIRNISGLLVKKEPHKVFETSSAYGKDSVEVGDLLLRVDQKRPKTLSDVGTIIDKVQGDSVDVSVERPSEYAELDFRLPRSEVSSTMVKTIPPTADVFEVIDGGASDRAGMKVGDLILRINGGGFNDVLEADSIMRRGQIGKTIEYQVLRAGKVLMLNVTLAAFGFPISLLVVFFSGLLYMGTGAFLSFKRPHLNAARLTGIALMLIGLFIICALIQRDFTPDLFVRLRTFTMIVALYFGVALVFHSGHYFPKERPELLSRPWLRITLYLLAVAGTVVRLTTTQMTSPYVLGIMLLFIFGTLIRFRKKSNQEYRSASRIINWTSVISIVSAIAVGMLINKTNDQKYFILLGITLALIPLSYLYSIGRYRLLDIDLRVRRNIQYSIVSWVWVLLLAGASLFILVKLPQAPMALPNFRLTGTSIEILDTPSLPGQQVPVEKALLMVIAVALTLVIGFVGRKGQELIDRLYDRARYDYRRAASELAEVMGTKLGMVDLARGIVEKLAQIMRLKQVGILFFRDEQSCCCTEAQGFDGIAWKSYCLASDKKLIEAIQRFNGAISVDYLPSEMKEIFRQLRFQYVVPIRSKGKLVGAIFVGEKLSESTFQQEDLELLSSTSKQASVAIENAFLYEELAEQERIKHELDIARRIQEGLLPKKNPSIRGLDVAGVSIPAMTVGGDYFDYIQLGPKKLLVVVADVSGKGMSAALYMSKIQGMVQLAAHMYKTPKEMLVHINRRIFEGLERKSFITMILAVFDLEKKEVRICRAGHNKALIRTNGKLQFLDAHGIGLGLERGKIFEKELQEIRRPLTKDGIFVFYSDGLTEAMDEMNNQFGEDTVHDLVDASRKSRAKELQDSILSSVEKFRGPAEPHDDLTLVVVKATPA